MHSLKKFLLILLAISLITVPTTAFASKTQTGISNSKNTSTSTSTSVSTTTDAGASTEQPSEEEDTAIRTTIMLTGDLMCQPRQQLAGYNGKKFDFTSTFKYVKPIFEEADVVIGNLETLVSKSLPLSKDMNKLQGKPYLNSPSQWLDALQDAGFDAFILANNHDCDGGKTGITETLAELDSRGIPSTGLYDSKSDKHYFIIESNGIKIGVLSYAGYFNKKNKFLGDDTWMLSMHDQAKADVKALKAAGAEYIIAYSHAGKEYSQIPNERQERFGLILAEAGVDYIIGSHPHVLQPYDEIKLGSRTIPYVYSMGNFTSAMLKDITKETIILSITLKKDDKGVTLAEQEYYPCYMLDEYEGEKFVLMPESLAKEDSELSAELASNYKHIRKIVGKM